MYDILERLAAAGELNAQPDTWKRLKVDNPEDDDLRLVKGFIMEHHQYSLAPPRITLRNIRIWHCCFTKLSINDLCTDGENLRKLDRCYALVWGRVEDDVEAAAAGERQDRPKYTTKMLSKKFPETVTTLPLHLEKCCDSKSFTLVICANPSGSLIPDEFASEIRSPACGDMIDYIHDTPEFFTTILRGQLLDFDAHVELGRQMSNSAVNLMNMDRSLGDSAF
jgi:hypothetical protein